MKKGRIEVIFFIIIFGVVFVNPGAWGAEVEVGQVVVTATKTEVEISEVPQSISVITREEILRTPDRTLGEIIQRVAGVEVSQNGPRGSLALPRIRGSEPAQVLVLLNGRRINDAQLALFDLSSLPVTKEEIERIEVLRGGASALYGTDAMGGVIQIITKRGTPRRRAVRARQRVPRTLFFTASNGFHSIIGTCLWAAAWKTTWGRKLLKMFSNRGRSRISAITGCIGRAGKFSKSSRTVSKMLFSPCPSRISICGPHRAIWRQISRPIEPPAPVTRIRFNTNLRSIAY